MTCAQNRHKLHHTRCIYVMYDVVHCQIVTIWVSRVETAAKCFCCQTLTQHLASPVSRHSLRLLLPVYWYQTHIILPVNTHTQHSLLTVHCIVWLSLQFSRANSPILNWTLCYETVQSINRRSKHLWTFLRTLWDTPYNTTTPYLSITSSACLGPSVLVDFVISVMKLFKN